MQQIDCLGDSNNQIRAAAANAVQIILQQWLAATLSKLAVAWTHRNYKVKEGAMAAVTAVIANRPVAISLPDHWDTLVLAPALQLLADPHRYFFMLLMSYFGLCFTLLSQTHHCQLCCTAFNFQLVTCITCCALCNLTPCQVSTGTLWCCLHCSQLVTLIGAL